ncbi:FAD-binding oxidoreductase [uncultured Marinococcus sp.]|uniref:FAD-binding oxidoreductase n=1 Tax=uncultured Marinococcus sp. TaxID=487012 RepID=UPI00261189E9|nr:FAD-linked oxidase C-terminal domain-containing protein [uncultured Marinococcus sp.]
MEAKWITALKSTLGEKYVRTAVVDRHSYSYDGSFGEYVPEAVVQVASARQVSEVMKIANHYRVPVTPRGQGTCLSGGPLPVYGGMVLDTSQWPASIEVYADDLIAEVSPGTLTSAIHQEVEAYGLMYPPDPSSAHVSTIGGNLAENSGGPRGLKYGVTKDYVIGLEVVTPEGEITRTGGRTIKNVTGLDITKLIVGSEGVLGVITSATLKLIPKPKAVQTIMVAFASMETAGRAISTTLTSGILPSKMEFIDHACVQAVEAYEPSGLPQDAEAVLIMELDGHEETINKELQEILTIMKQLEATAVQVPETAEAATRIWKARKMVSPAIATIKPTKVSEDATVPRSQIPLMMKKLGEIREKYEINLVVFGHAGDGNLHPNILCDERDQAEMKRVEKAVEDIFQAAIDLGGTLSGEHGIGTMKSPFMENEIGIAGVDLMKRIKQSWDPNNIMNPGKIFAEPGQRLVLSRE